jgi:uncharacterized membrane protein YfcA
VIERKYLLDLVYVLLSLFFGGLVGLLLGLLGGGGSILTIPVLVYIIGQNVHSATGTSLAIVGSSALLGAFLHSRRGDVRLKSGVLLGFMSMLGAVPGVWLNRIVAGETILVLFSILMIVIAVDILRSEPSSSQKTASRLPCELYTSKDWLKIMAVGLLVGVLTGFFGVGGGFLIVPALVLIGNFPIRQAVGTSLLVIFMTSFSGFMSNLAFGGLDPITVLIFAVGGSIGVLSGTSLADHVSGRTLNRTFSLFVIFVALYLIYTNILR